MSISHSKIGVGIRKSLSEVGLPASDNYELPDSGQQFSAGGHYGIEISSVNNFNIMENLLKLLDQYEIRPDRFDECRGIFRLPDSEIKEMVDLCKERKIGLIMSVGPRAIYDIGAFSKSKNGARIGYRLRGMENIVRAVEEVQRALEFGVRGFLIYDEGLLWTLNELRKKGTIPTSTILKLSVHACPSNPASCRLLETSGADTINLIPDLELPMLSAIRATVNCPLDIFSDTAAEAGGFIRTYEVPEFIRIASPIYLKCGPISQPEQNHLPSPLELIERAKQTKCVLETIERYYPDANQVGFLETTKAIPQT